jgi:hypothetical protein
MRKAHREFEEALPEEKREGFGKAQGGTGGGFLGIGKGKRGRGEKGVTEVVDKKRNPITAYRRERGMTPPSPTSYVAKTNQGAKNRGSQDDGYEMQPSPPREQITSQYARYPQGEGDDYFGPSSTATTNAGAGAGTAERGRPLFSPRSNNLYANVPLTPNTPMPLLAGYESRDSSQVDLLRAGSPAPSSKGSARLVVKTDFDPPPKKGGRGILKGKGMRQFRLSRDSSGGCGSGSGTKEGSGLRNVFSS